MPRRNVYKQRSPVAALSADKDWSDNFVDQLGYGGNAEFIECMRLYLFLHRSAQLSIEHYSSAHPPPSCEPSRAFRDATRRDAPQPLD